MPSYVLTTPPQRELDAVAVLSRRDVAAWTPVEFVEKRQRGRQAFERQIWITRPLLPGYVIVDLPSTDAVAGLVYKESRAFRPVVRGYLGIGGQPSMVSDKALAALKSVDGQHKPLSRQVRHRPGDVIMVHGRQVTIVSVRGDRARAIADWFGSQREIDVDLGRLLEAG